MDAWKIGDIIFGIFTNDLLQNLNKGELDSTRKYDERVQELRKTLSPEQDEQLYQILHDKTELLLFFKPNDFQQGFRIGTNLTADMLAGNGELTERFEKIIKLLNKMSKKKDQTSD